MTGFLKTWLKGNEASAAVEAGILFPVMVSMMLGVIDIGTAVVVNQKVINAAHIMVDLVTRGATVSSAQITDAGVAAQMALAPYSTATLAWDVEGIQYTGSPPSLKIQWDVPFNMNQNLGALTTLTNAGYTDTVGQGVVAVTVKYTYTPMFVNFISGSYPMQEVSFARGRQGVFVTKTS